jgi:hypothetical protein
VIAATNRDLEAAIACGKFRDDLYYPPQRGRDQGAPAAGARQRQLVPETLARLMAYSWPGNVRELENAIRRLVVPADGEKAIEAMVTRGCHGQNGHKGDFPAPRPTVIEGGLKEVGRRGAREAERKALLEVLDGASWNRAEAARILKVSYKSAAREDLRLRSDAASSSLTGRAAPMSSPTTSGGEFLASHPGTRGTMRRRSSNGGPYVPAVRLSAVGVEQTALQPRSPNLSNCEQFRKLESGILAHDPTSLVRTCPKGDSRRVVRQ